MNVSPRDLPHNELYSILLNSVAPRPIAWVSTASATGLINLAPFSFFNVVCTDPPLLAFVPGMRGPKQPGASQGEAKDTLRNIRETKEFVVNIVTYELAEAMNLTSGEYDASVNEFELANLTPQASEIVRPPGVAESPVSFECKLHQILNFSSAPTGGSLVIGEIVSIHMNDAHIKEGKLDRNAGSDWAHGRNSVYPDDAEIRDGAAEGWVSGENHEGATPVAAGTPQSTKQDLSSTTMDERKESLRSRKWRRVAS